MKKVSKTIGWIGTGIMGKSMCSHLLKAGYPVNIYNRTKSKAQQLLSLGAIWMEPREIAKSSDIVILMLGYPVDVQEMTIGQNGIVKYMKKQSILIDHTTSKSRLAIKIYNQCLKNQIFSLDAPVSGGDRGARDANLVIMCGGEQKPFQQAKSIMSVYGKNIHFSGGPGKGQHTKMANQIVVAGNIIGVVEGLLYASKMGLDVNQVIDTIKTGAANSVQLTVNGPKMIARNFDPGFYVEHYIKDLQIALEQCLHSDLCLPNIALVKQFYVALKAQSGGKIGIQALIKVLQQMNNHQISN